MKSQTYKCSNCDSHFSTKFNYQEHKNIHVGDFPFKCRLCRSHFFTVKDYVSHLDEIHIRGKFTCSVQPKVSVEDDIHIHHIQFIHNRVKSTVGSDLIFASSVSSEGVIQDMSYKGCDDTECEKRKTGDFTRYKTDAKPLRKTWKSNKVQNVYSCIFCSMNFNSLREYNQHKKSLHAFLCENCNNRYSSREKLMKHMCFVSSHGEPFKCSCSLTFTKAIQFRVHIGCRPYSCCSCSMQFDRISNLIRHIRTHTKQKPYICRVCGRGFSQSTNLRNHASVHLGVKAIRCNECDFSCKTLSGLLKHKHKHKESFMKQEIYIDKRKTSTGTVTCPICKKGFPFKRNVAMHLKVHKRKETLCQECGKVYESKSKLTTHYKASHGVPSVCQVCGKTFASAILLSAHEKIHVPGKNFSCPKCYKMFSVKNYLVQHMKTHTEVKQYSCNKCGKLFKVAVSLKYHNKICASLNVT